jgi:hypothetical protein
MHHPSPRNRIPRLPTLPAKRPRRDQRTPIGYRIIGRAPPRGGHDRARGGSSDARRVASAPCPLRSNGPRNS